jgi:hypothetical protein
MLSAVDEITAGKGTNFFLFGHRARFGATSPLDENWKTGKNMRVKLTE